MTDWLQNSEFRGNLLNTALLIVLMLTARVLLNKTLSNIRKREGEFNRKWIVYINNGFSLLFTLGLVAVWSTELQAFAISIVALGAAVVLATREMILCFLGGIYKSISRPFTVGDRIEIAGIRGEVVNINFLSTQILELGPTRQSQLNTGRLSSIPNSLFLTNSVHAETRTARFRMHAFSLHLPHTISAIEIQKILVQAAEETCADYADEAHQYFSRSMASAGLEPPSSTVKVAFHYAAKDQIDFSVRVPVPAMRASAIEQAIISSFSKSYQAPPSPSSTV